MQHRYNLSKLEKPNLVETDEGFLQIKGNILKADSFMEYRNKRGVLREKIPKEILFSEETKKSFLNKKITLEHPMENGKLAMVDSKNVNQFGKGNVIEVFENGDYLGATLQVEDPDTIQFIKERYKNNENVELSAGYSAETELIKDGEYIQKDIQANHVAVLAGKGRAGSDVRLIYNYLDYEEEKKVKFNGKEVTNEELLAEALTLQSENKDLKDKYNAEKEEKEKVEKEKNDVESEKEELKKQIKELEEKLAKLEGEKEEKEIKENAKSVLNSFDEKEDTVKIMEKVIKELNPKFNAAENSKIEDLKSMFDFSVEALLQNTKVPPKKTETDKFNSNEQQGLTLKIDNTYFSKKRNGGQ